LSIILLTLTFLCVPIFDNLLLHHTTTTVIIIIIIIFIIVLIAVFIFIVIWLVSCHWEQRLLRFLNSQPVHHLLVTLIGYYSLNEADNESLFLEIC
jgi:hypothetical protein